MSSHFERGVLLYTQDRFDLAEKELRAACGETPDVAEVHSFLALCLSEQSRHEEAIDEAQTAVGLAPDSALAHFAMARVLLPSGQLKRAAEAIGESIRLDPYDADAWATLAGIQLERSEWKAALASAEQGLAVDAEHGPCANLRALALVKLGRTQEASDQIAETLAQSPESGVAHANQGWALIEQGKYKEAQHHFREALRLDPDLDWAREGMITALKARSRIYRLALNFFLWMSKRSDKAQWAVIIGLVVGIRLLRWVGEQAPALSPFVTAVVVLYFGFVLLTWLADPLFNLLLRLHPFGRHALSRDQVRGANLVGGTLLLSLLSAVALATISVLAFGVGLSFNLSDPMAKERFINVLAILVLGAVGFFAWSIPCSAVYRCRPGWTRNLMGAYALVGALVLVASLVGIWTNAAWHETTTMAFVWLFVGAFWVGNGLMAIGR